MIQLLKGMYSNGSELFGLSCCQSRKNVYTANSYWYNKRGELLGWGDLSPDDFRTISANLESDEFFILVSEWDQPDTNKFKFDAPGVDFVAKMCVYIIAKNTLYVVGFPEGSFDEDGLRFTAVDRDAVKRIIVS